jgi:uncharacterized iron-regulated protein
MNPRRITIALFIISLLFGFQTSPARAHILVVGSNQYVTLDLMMNDLRNASIVFIGEMHDQPGHHQAQLQVIQGLQQAAQPLAIGLEMVRRENQLILDRWVAGTIEEEEFRQVFEKDWGMWPQYAEIFTWARDNQVPLIALNIPREITQQVAREGFASLSPEQLESVPGVNCTVDPTYQEFIRRSLGSHAHGDAEFENFCEAQMVWDTTMAQRLIDYLDANPDRTVVVLAGIGHAWKHGVPEQIRQRAADLQTRVLLPEVAGRIAAGEITTEEADYLLQGIEEAPLH